MYLGKHGWVLFEKQWVEAQTKIYPVINGMETNRFVVMRNNEANFLQQLFPVYELKGVKIPIQAAAIIVNVYKLTSYRRKYTGHLTKIFIHVWMWDLISSNNLGSNVFVRLWKRQNSFDGRLDLPQLIVVWRVTAGAWRSRTRWTPSSLHRCWLVQRKLLLAQKVYWRNSATETTNKLAMAQMNVMACLGLSTTL